MSHSNILFSNLIFHFLQIIWTPNIFNNFSSCEILIFQMVESNSFIFQIVKFYKIVIENNSIIILLVHYLGNWLIFQIRNFWNFLNWRFLGGIQNIEWSNVERPRFRNFKITNIKIMKDDLFSYLRIQFFIFLNENVKFKKFVISLFWKW